MLWSKDTDLKKIILINLKTITCLCTGSTESPIWPQGSAAGWLAHTRIQQTWKHESYCSLNASKWETNGDTQQQEQQSLPWEDTVAEHWTVGLLKDNSIPARLSLTDLSWRQSRAWRSIWGLGASLLSFLDDHLPYKPSDDKPAPSSSPRQDTCCLSSAFWFILCQDSWSYTAFLLSDAVTITLSFHSHIYHSSEISLDCAGSALSS